MTIIQYRDFSAFRLKHCIDFMHFKMHDTCKQKKAFINTWRIDSKSLCSLKHKCIVSPCAFYSSTVPFSFKYHRTCIYISSGAFFLFISLSLYLTFFLSFPYGSQRKKRLWYCLMCHRVQDRLVCINLSSCHRIVSNVFDEGKNKTHRERWYTHERFIGQDLFFFRRHSPPVCTEA